MGTISAVSRETKEGQRQQIAECNGGDEVEVSLIRESLCNSEVNNVGADQKRASDLTDDGEAEAEEKAGTRRELGETRGKGMSFTPLIGHCASQDRLCNLGIALSHTQTSLMNHLGISTKQRRNVEQIIHETMTSS